MSHDRPPVCATRVFVPRSPLAGVHAVVPADSRGVSQAPWCIPCVPGTMRGHARPDRLRSSGHVMGPSPSRTTVFPVEPSWSLGRPALLCSPGHVPVPPRDSATFFRRNRRPECVRHGVWASLVFALPFSPHRPARLPALLPPVLSPLGLGAKTGTKIGTKIGATRRPPCRRGSRARPAAGQAGRRERHRPAEALPLGQVRV